MVISACSYFFAWLFLNKMFDSLSNKKLALNSRASEVPTPVRSGETEEKTKRFGENKKEQLGIGSVVEYGNNKEVKGGDSGDLTFIVYPQGISSVTKSDYQDRSKLVFLNIRGSSGYGRSCEEGSELKRHNWSAIKKYELKKNEVLNIPIFKHVEGGGLSFKGNVVANVQIVDDKVRVTALPADGMELISYDESTYEYGVPPALALYHGSKDRNRYYFINPDVGRNWPSLRPGDKSSLILSVDTMSLNFAGIRWESIEGEAYSPDAIFACIDLPEFTGLK